MICFVTGAAGFVGRVLVDTLLHRGDEVRALDLRFPADFSSNAVRREGDICDTTLLYEACRDTEVVFHLAALLPQRHAPPERMRHVNVDGLSHLLAAARRAGVRRVIQLSSAEVYGVPMTAPCPEDAPLQPLGEYGRNKVEAEQLARAAVADGLDVVILRPPTVVGPTMVDRVLLGTLAALRRGWPIVVPGGRERFQMVAVSDLVSASLAAAEANGVAGEAFNIGSDAVPSQVDTFRRLRHRVGSRSPVIPLPRPLLRGLFHVLAALHRSPLEPEHVPIALADYVFDIRKAREGLGWSPIKDNVDALAETYASLTTDGNRRELSAPTEPTSAAGPTRQ